MESKTPEECRRCIHGEVCRYVHVEKPEPCVFRDLGTVEELAALKERTHAERDEQLYTLHDVAVILASAIGDNCACNINSNDEWLPRLCELQEACQDPVGVACWEQYLKHRAEAEKALGKEQG